MTRQVEFYCSNTGASIYRLPLELFPGFWGYAHLVLMDGLAVLVDVGSGLWHSNEHLEAGLRAVREEHGEQVDWPSLTHVLITHGHVDHFGGLPYVIDRTQARIGIHELDRKVLTTYQERLTVVARRLRQFLMEAGLGADKTNKLMNLYLLNKQLFSSVEVDFTYEAVGLAVGTMRLIHVPGHCPGQTVIQVGDVLLSGDHVLNGISPHQAPERLSYYTGLGHYLDSLAKLLPLAGEVNLTLGGHEGPIECLESRTLEILRLHGDRLRQVWTVLEAPRTIASISQTLFPKATGYHELLAVEEAGAHVEYLVQRGYLEIENLEELRNDGPVAIRYRRLDGFIPELAIPGLVGEPLSLLETPD